MCSRSPYCFHNKNWHLLFCLWESTLNFLVHWYVASAGSYFCLLQFAIKSSKEFQLNPGFLQILRHMILFLVGILSVTQCIRIDLKFPTNWSKNQRCCEECNCRDTGKNVEETWQLPGILQASQETLMEVYFYVTGIFLSYHFHYCYATKFWKMSKAFEIPCFNFL